jgi:phage-related protein
MVMKSSLVYQGESFRLEWFRDESGYSQSLEYFDSLDAIQQVKAMQLFRRMGDSGKIFDITKFRNEGDKIFAFKPMPDRFLSFFTIGKLIVITNAFVKKSDKLPTKEKERAVMCMKDYKRRVSNGTYYKA